jgi:hypothetical protein
MGLPLTPAANMRGSNLTGAPMRVLARAAVLLGSMGLTAGGCYPSIDMSGVNKGQVGDDTGDVDDVLCDVWKDADGDSFGDPASPARVPCDDIPADHVDNASDCDDADATSFPDAPERCDDIDNDCDGVVDEDLTYDWYGDADADGFGALDAYEETCNPGPGLVADATDCDDSRADVFPGADEICDDADNDCDSEVDEDPIDAPIWYTDADLDGFGGAPSTTVACDAPEGTVGDNTDCDDADAAIHPDAQEVCDPPDFSVDNDCDGLADDDDPDVDLSTGTEWYADSDTDGFGDAATTVMACAEPSGHVGNADDCDDTRVGVNPDAAEACNEIDDDCDGLVDDDDDDLDTSTAATFFADLDADGYGDPSNTVAACELPSGYLTDNLDCDDTDAAISPAATEVCDSVDNDCDGDIDDDDSDLDLSTTLTWYADADSDGFGDPTVSAEACLEPSGYCDNDQDCDDTDAADGVDLDVDGTPDCADADIDGDGLRNVWDGAEDDATIARGPTGGLGGDGALSIGASTFQTEWTLLSSGASSGDTSLAVDDPSLFSVGDEILVLSQQGSDAGQYQLVFVSTVGTALTIEPPLTDAYSGSSIVLVQPVPHYAAVDVTSTLSASSWRNLGGGVVIFRATGQVTISGTVTASSRGYDGGDGVSGRSSAGIQGESWDALGAVGDSSANDGGGGAPPLDDDGCESGGGGGYATSADDGYGLYCSSWTSYGYCTGYSWAVSADGGDSYGSASLTEWFMGSGGGGGAPDAEYDGNDSRNVSGDGGDGGGIVAIYSATGIAVSGSVLSIGDDGDDADAFGGEIGGGGGAAGGSILLVAPALTVTGGIYALGGAGGDGDSWSHSSCGVGGDGADGRIRLEYTTLNSTGDISPSVGSTGAYAD